MFAVQSRNRPRFFEQVGHETMFVSSGNKHFFTKSCHHQTYQNYEQPPQSILLKNVFENVDYLNTLFSKKVPNFCRLCS